MVGIVIAGIGVIFWYELRVERVQRIERLVAAATAGVGASVESELDRSTRIVRALADQAPWSTPSADADSAVLRAALGSYERASLLDPGTGAVLEIVSGAGRRGTPGSQDNSSTLANALRRLQRSAEPVIAAPILLGDGEPGFHVLARTLDRFGAPAVLNVSFSASGAFGEFLAKAAPGYRITVRVGRHLLLRRGTTDRLGARVWAQARPVQSTAALRPWTVRLRPPAAVLGAPLVALPELVLLSSCLIAALLMLVLRQRRVLRHRGGELADTVERRTEELRQMLGALRAENRVRQQTQARLGSALELNRLVSVELQPDGVKQTVVDGAMRLTGATASAFFDVSADCEPSLAASAARGEGVLDEAETADAARALLNCGEARVAGDAPPVETPMAKCVAARVIGRDGAVTGVLVLSYSDPVSSHVEDREALVALTAHAGIALDNARLFSEAERARAEAERAIAAKDQFLAILGHELRNPLGSIRNALRVLKATADERVSGRMERIAERQVHHLGRLVDDLFDASRLAVGTMEIRKSAFDLRVLLLELAENERMRLTDSGLELAVDIADGPTWVEGDRDRIGQAVANLLNNAAKYTTAPGCVRLELARVEGGALARVTVADTGQGIDGAEMEGLFDAFSRRSRSGDRAASGLGLGLSIARAIVDAHGGSIRAASEGRHRGSTFTLELPLDERRAAGIQDAPLAEAPSTDDATSVASSMRVLVAEDQADAAEALVELLGLEGHSVDVVDDGLAAVDAVVRLRPDILLCDIDLPGIDGYEVARRLRDTPLDPAPVLVALTGYGDAASVKRGADAGFDDYLVKPLDIVALRAVMHRLERARG